MTSFTGACGMRLPTMSTHVLPPSLVMGFEAEVFFETGPYAAGQAHVRWAGCEDRWNIDLVLIDRDAVPSRT